MKKESRKVERGGRGRLALLSLAASLVLATGALVAATSSTGRSVRHDGWDRLSLAKIAYADRNYPEAESLLREIQKSGTWEISARLLLGRVLLDRGRPSEARETLAAVLKEEPKNVEALRGLGAAYKELGQLDLAIVFLTQAAEIGKSDAKLWKELGFAQRERGDSMGALSSFQQSLSIDGGQGELSNLMAELVTAKNSPAGGPGGVSHGPGNDPFTPRPIDPESLVPRPRVPDPAQHFPKPGGRNR